MRVLIEPMGAVRMTGRGKWVKPNAQRYLAYKAEIGWQLKLIESKPIEGACKVEIKFYMPIPKSWSKKKQREAIGKPHTSMPDIDNLVKGVFDSANGICWQDDRQVVECVASKVYGEEPGFEIRVEKVSA